MIPNIGMMLAVYAIARLIQVPIEAATFEKKWLLLLLISLPAIAIIGFLALDLIMSSAKQTIPPGLR